MIKLTNYYFGIMQQKEVEKLKNKISILKSKQVLILDEKSKLMVREMNAESELYKMGKIKKTKIATFFFN